MSKISSASRSCRNRRARRSTSVREFIQRRESPAGCNPHMALCGPSPGQILVSAPREDVRAGWPAMIHVSEACNTPYFQTTGSYYLAADTVAFMQMMTSDLFKDFPDLKLIIPHGGGAVPYHWGRFRGLADMLKRPPLKESVLNNVYFDTCVYHQPGIDLLLDVIPVDNILFASEMVGAVRGIDPETGHYFDDTKRYIDGNKKLSAADRAKIFESNARRVFKRFPASL
jgi:4-oxalmesaconate hydratase